MRSASISRAAGSARGALLFIGTFRFIFMKPSSKYRTLESRRHAAALARLTITGGCNCRSIVYRIAIPPLEERPLHPNCDPNSGLSPIHQPYIFADHCNDCRRATGSIVPACISGPLDYVSVSLHVATEGTQSKQEEVKQAWHPARQVFTDKNAVNGVNLSELLQLLARMV